MALTKCSLCGKRISSSAVACPGCGEPRPESGWPELKKAKFKWCIIAFAIVVVIFLFTYRDLEQKVYALTPWIDVVYNSPIDKSVSQVEKYIKNRLKDPDSFEVIEWGDVVKGPDGACQVTCLYRAKNSFGAYVVEDVLIQLDKHGNVTKSVKFID
jgi:hypothetical protein